MKPFILTASVLFLILFSGCATRPQPQEKVSIDKTLPQVQINGFLSDISAIAFEWKPLTDPRVKGIRIYRDTPSDGSGKLFRIAQVEGTLQTHFVDSGLTPATKYRYRFTTYDGGGKESLPDNTVTAATLENVEPVSFFTAAHSLARSAKLIWRPHTDLRVTGYAIERRDDKGSEFRTIDTIDGRLNAEYIDRGLDDGKIYRYRIRAVTFDGRRSAPTPDITVSTKPLPAPPANLQATKGGIGEITLSWDADAKARNYKIYRGRSQNGYYTYLAESQAPGFTDRPVENGMTYFYQVTGIDEDELESPRGKAAAGTTLAAPKPPVMNDVTLKEGAAVISWQPGDDRAERYTLVKTTKTGWLESSTGEFDDIKTTRFTDVNIVPGREYIYEVIAVDEHGLRSEPSEQRSVVPEAP